MRPLSPALSHEGRGGRTKKEREKTGVWRLAQYLLLLLLPSFSYPLPPCGGGLGRGGPPGHSRTDTPPTNAHTPANLVHRKRILRLTVRTLALLCCCIGTPTYAQPSAAEFAARLQARYDETRAFHADFVQEVSSAALGRTLTSRGHVYFEKPGRMRWEFAEPQQTLIADGASFWLYQPAENQVIKTPFRSAFNSQTPISFLTGVGRLEEDFAVSPQGETERVHRLRLLPKRDAAAVGRLDVEVDKATFDILQATVTDPLGNTTRLRFSHIERVDDLDDDLFRFALPAGVDLVQPLAGR